jgi:hypothetical protein
LAWGAVLFIIKETSRARSNLDVLGLSSYIASCIDILKGFKTGHYYISFIVEVGYREYYH